MKKVENFLNHVSKLEPGCAPSVEYFSQIIAEAREAKVEFEEFHKTNVIRRFLEEVSKEKNIPIERLITGVMQGDLYVWDYDSGRHLQDQFRVVAINGL